MHKLYLRRECMHWLNHTLINVYKPYFIGVLGKIDFHKEPNKLDGGSTRKHVIQYTHVFQSECLAQTCSISSPSCTTPSGGSGFSSSAFLSDVKLYASCRGFFVGGPIMSLLVAGRFTQEFGVRRSLSLFCFVRGFPQHFISCGWQALLI